MIDAKYALIPSYVDPVRGEGVQTTPHENLKSIGFLGNTGPDPLTITMLLSQHSMLGHHRYACETAFRWRANDSPLIQCSIIESFLPSSTKNTLSVGPYALWQNFLDLCMSVILTPHSALFDVSCRWHKYIFIGLVCLKYWLMHLKVHYFQADTIE